MSTSQLRLQMETELIMTHNNLVRSLEAEYTNHICKLLKQKSEILNNLQRQFIERRNIIKQRFENQNVIIQDNSNSSNANIQNTDNQPLPPLEAEHDLDQMDTSTNSNNMIILRIPQPV